MVSYGYLFLRKAHRNEDYPPDKDWSNYPKLNDMMLYLWLESDTEFTCAYHRTGREPLPIEFEDANQANTLLHAAIYINRRDRTEKTNWFHNVVTDDYKSPYGEVINHKKIADMQIYRSRFDLVDMGDEDSVLTAAERLKSEFITATCEPWPPGPAELAPA